MEGKNDGSGPHGTGSLVRKANFKQENTRVVSTKEYVQGTWMHEA